MRERVQQLEFENARLRSKLIDPDSINVQTFHWLPNQGQRDTSYLSEPEWEQHDEQILLRGRFPVPDPVGYSQHHSMSFIIYKYYDHLKQEPTIRTAVDAKKALPTPKAHTQAVILISDEMVEAMQAFFAQTPSCLDVPKLTEMHPLHPPYIWWYHRRKSHDIQSLPKRQAQLVMALVDRIEANYALLFNAVDGQLHRGRVSHFSMPFLFRPGEVLVLSEAGVSKGHVALACPKAEDDTWEDKHASKKTVSWSILCHSLEYSGEFYLSKGKVDVVLETELPDDEVDISTLNAIPLKYVAHGVQQRLAQRAKKWWKLRTKQLVSHNGTGSSGTQAVCRSSRSERNQLSDLHQGQRFMIDFNAYKELHPNSKYSRRVHNKADEYSPSDSQGPQAPEIYLFPIMVPGFDLRRKKWGKSGPFYGSGRTFR